MGWFDIAKAAAEYIFTPTEANPGEDQYMEARHEAYQAGETHQHHVDQQHDYASHHHDEVSHQPADYGHSVSDGLGGSY